jgi:hypothetical protein
MKLGKFSLEQELIVAKIDDLAGILGMDFLEVQNADIYILICYIYYFTINYP